MKRRILAIVLVLAMFLSFSSGILPAVSAENALPIFNSKTEYGTGVFNYYVRDITTGVNTQMTFNEGAKLFMHGVTANVIGSDYLSAGANPAIGSMLVFTAPYSGTITISNGRAEGLVNRGKLGQRTEYVACYATVYGADWSTLASYSIPANETPAATPDITNIEVVAGQQIRFLLGSNLPLNSYVIWNPIISYTTVSEETHQHQWQPEWAATETHHWHECVAGCSITDNAGKDAYGEHIDADDNQKCDVCDHEMPANDGGTELVYSFVDGYQTESANTGVWRYYVREVVTNSYTPMNFNSSTQRWEAPATMGAAYIWRGHLHTSASATATADYQTALQFVAPYEGKITVSFPGGLHVPAESSDGVTFFFWENGASNQHNDMHNGLVPGQALELPSYTINVQEGQKLNFLFHRKGSNAGDTITINPTITYLEVSGEGETPSATMTMEELLVPVWEGNTVYNESVMVLKNPDGSIDPISLIYPIAEVVSVYDSALKVTYKENVDYKIENGKLVVLPTGSIPKTDYDQYYLKNEVAGNSFAATQGGYIYFAEGKTFHEKQISITYKHTSTWQGAVPEEQAERLPKTIKKLENKEKLKIVYYGDSITVGANSSSFVGAAPNLPTWSEMVTNALKHKYGYNDIVSVNNAKGGQGIVWGLQNINSLVAAEKPDLVFIGFGMNDNTDNATYGQYIKSMMNQVRQSNPNCEFVLIGTMLPNAEVRGFFTNHDKYVLALDEIAKDNSGVAVADITTVHSDLLKIKRYYDMTGNNVNHPNDFLARIYLQVIMQTFEGDGSLPSDEETLPVYNLKADYGSDVFGYYTRDITNGVNTQMTFNSTHNMYMYGATANYIASDYFSAGANAAVGSMLVFTAPYSGTITISNGREEGLLNRGKLGQRTEYAACYATIYGTDWSTLASYSIPAGPDPVATPDITNIQVAAGQQIRFLLGSNTPMNSYVIWIPVISYTEVNSTVHQHTWQESWQTNESYHWHECTDDCDITDNAQKDGYGEHIDADQNQKCDVCGYDIVFVDLETAVVTLIAPVDGAKETVVSEVVSDWLAVYDVNNTTGSPNMGKGDNYYKGVEVKWKLPTAGATTTVIYATDAEFTDAKSVTVMGTSSVVLYNLYTDTKYYWKVQAAYSNGTVTSDVFTFTTEDTPRVVYIDGVSNTRDIGGWAISDKINIKQGMIYRGATLNEITENGLEQAKKDLGIRTELDLRGIGEDGCGTLFPLGNDVGYYNYHTAYYGNILKEENWSDIAAAVKLFADEDNYPIYFHCRLCRDRTGTLSVLLLGLLGASKEQVLLDYELSCFSYMGGSFDGASYASVKQNALNLYNALANYSDGTFQENVEQYLLDIGVTAKEIASIRAIMTDGALGGDDQTHSHDWLYAWQSDSTHHWHECAGDCNITDNAEKAGYSEHIDGDIDGLCDVCNHETVIAGPDEGVYSFTDMFSDDQSGVWKYRMREAVTNTYTDMTWDGKQWVDGKGGLIAKTALHSSANAGANHEMQTCLEFVVPYDGVISVSMLGGAIKVSPSSDNGVKVAIWKNVDPILAYTDIKAGESYKFAPATVKVKEGDCIRFLVTAINGNNAGDVTTMLPIIAYSKGSDHAEHIWEEAWTSNETHHWHECTSFCEMDNTIKDGYAEHADVNIDGLCDACSAEVALPGVKDGVYSFKDMFSDKQTGVWKYRMREAVTNTYTDMTWDGTQWVDGKGGLIAKTALHSSANAGANHEMQTCLEFVSPYDGVVSLSMLGGSIKVSPNSDNGVKIAIWKNVKPILAYTDLKAGEVYEFAPTSVKVKEGDIIRFLVTANNGNNAGDVTTMLPIITFKSIEYRLGPDQGVYSAMDMFSGKQTDIWQYLTREAVSNSYKELNWDGEKWVDGKGGIIASEAMHPSPDASDKHETQMCLTFTAPSDGVVKIRLEDDVINVSQQSQNGVRFGIMQNGNMIYTYTDFGRGEHWFAPITINITKGDRIYFLLCPINGNTAGDSTNCMPIISYLSYEKAPDPVLEEVPDDPSKTYYNSTDDFGGYLNPWYYMYCTVGSQVLESMTWNKQAESFAVADRGGLLIGSTSAHPYPGYDAVRVFRAPKSGTISITMNDDAISLGKGSSGHEDGVYVSIRMSDGSSITELYKKTLVLPGETVSFDPIEMKIYEGWELWFVVNCNKNNASDSTKFAPIIEYLEITDEEAPVYSNRDEAPNEISLDKLNPGTSTGDVSNAKNNGMNVLLIVATFVAITVVVNAVVLLIVKCRKKKNITK